MDENPNRPTPAFDPEQRDRADQAVRKSRKLVEEARRIQAEHGELLEWVKTKDAELHRAMRSSGE